MTWYGITPDHRTFPLPEGEVYVKKSANRSEWCVAVDDLPNGFTVSTVFIGIDWALGERPPMIFETMVFKLPSYRDLDCERYSTWAQAEKGHKQMCMRWITVLETEGPE